LIIDFPMKKPPRRTALLIWCVAVVLLAYAPWNLGLLIIGCSFSRRLDKAHDARRIYVRSEA
jgi:hypothetical protein